MDVLETAERQRLNMGYPVRGQDQFVKVQKSPKRGLVNSLQLVRTQIYDFHVFASSEGHIRDRLYSIVRQIQLLNAQAGREPIFGNDQ